MHIMLFMLQQVLVFAISEELFLIQLKDFVIFKYHFDANVYSIFTNQNNSMFILR
jgi:hypothetical protein